MTQKRVAPGASSGIGRATAAGLLKQGFRVFGTLRETSRESGLLAELSGFELAQLDVRDREHLADGAPPDTVASIVLKALTSRSPRLRYPAGREAKFLSFMRRFGPSRSFDRGLRKQFRLEAA